MAQQWFYSRDGRQRLGPLTSTALRALATSGGLLPSDMVLKEGTGQWVPAVSVKGLFPGVNDSTLDKALTGGPAIRFVCPRCNAMMEAPLAHAGKKIHCRKCGQRLQVPASEHAQTMLGRGVEAPASQPSPPPFEAAIQVPARAAPASSPAIPSKVGGPGLAPESWWVTGADQQQHGPMPRTELETWITQGRVDPESLVFTKGWSSWQAASLAFPAFFARPRSGILTALGIIAIVYGALALLCGIGNFYMGAFAADAADPLGHAVPRIRLIIFLGIALGILGIAKAAACIAGGIGVLNRLRWGKMLVLVGVSLALVMLVLESIVLRAAWGWGPKATLAAGFILSVLLNVGFVIFANIVLVRGASSQEFT